MTKESNDMARASPTLRSRWSAWAAYSACGWAFMFAALSFFWAAGGRTGLHPLEVEVAPGNPMWIALNLGASILKALVGLIALALVRLWGRRIPHKLLLAVAWVLGVGMSLYGGLGLVSDVLHVTGVISDPANGKWFFWYLVLWDPWWLLGGILYVTAAWLARQGEIEYDAGSGTFDRTMT